MFYFNYVDLCNSINKSPSAVAEELGLKRSAVTRWSDGSVPRQATLQKIATYFGVTVDELMNGEQKEKDPTQMGEVSQTKKALIDMVYDMSDDECRRLAELINAAKKL